MRRGVPCGLLAAFLAERKEWLSVPIKPTKPN